jgi:hypothetical protein
MNASQKTCIGFALTVLFAASASRLYAQATSVSAQAAAADMYAQASPTAISTSPAEIVDLAFIGSGDEAPSAELALVIPDKEIDLAATNQAIEDLGIMSRIIEKNVLTPYSVRQAGWREVFVGGYGSPDVVGPRTLFPSGGRIKPLYIAGYGATFFIQVDFPLLAPPEKPQEPAASSQEDLVWAQTKQSLLDSRRTGTVVTGKPAGQPYNQAKVEGFRKSLIALMKHAANIRTLAANERLTLVVQGPAPATATPGPSTRTGLVLPAIGVSSGRNVMTLRATKADVDAYAKGQLSPEQFEQRVQAITY